MGIQIDDNMILARSTSSEQVVFVEIAPIFVQRSILGLNTLLAVLAKCVLSWFSMKEIGITLRLGAKHHADARSLERKVVRGR